MISLNIWESGDLEFKHTSVLLNECLEGLNIHSDGIYVDGTLGGGGHSLEIVKRLTTGRLIGIDQDAEALKAAAGRLAGFEDKITLVKNNFVNIRKILDVLNIEISKSTKVDDATVGMILAGSQWMSISKKYDFFY